MPIQVAFIINSSRKLNFNSIETLKIAELSASIQCDTFYTKYTKHAVELAEKLANEGYESIISFGGDGTNNEIINGIQLSKRKNDVRFGIVPNGSGNDFQKMLGKFSPSEFVKLLTSSQSKTIDLIELSSGNKTWMALNIAGIGFDGHVVHSLECIRKKLSLKGKLAYALAILKSFVSFRKATVSIKSADFNYDGKILMMAVCNGKAFGHGLFIHPEAEIDDGKLGITLLAQVTFLDYVKNLGKLKRGEKIQHPGVSYFKTESISISIPNNSLYTEVDGENLGQNDFNFKVLPNALKIIG
jgi:YegS/Rv2252/BmrU family lipid kinase